VCKSWQTFLWSRWHTLDLTEIPELYLLDSWLERFDAISKKRQLLQAAQDFYFRPFRTESDKQFNNEANQHTNSKYVKPMQVIISQLDTSRLRKVYLDGRVPGGGQFFNTFAAKPAPFLTHFRATNVWYDVIDLKLFPNVCNLEVLQLLEPGAWVSDAQAPLLTAMATNLTRLQTLEIATCTPTLFYLKLL